MKTSHLDVLLVKEADVWFAHGLQLDVAGQGDSIATAIDQMQFALATSLAIVANPTDDGEGDVVRLATQAPQEYWDKFEVAAPLRLEGGWISDPPEVEAPVAVHLPRLREARVG